MFLQMFVSAARAAEEAAPGFTPWEMWVHSGWIAKCVIITLALMVVAAIYTAIERLLAFNKARNQSMRLAAEIVGPLRKNDAGGALKLASDERFKASYLASVLRAGLTELSQRSDEFGLSSARRAVDKSTGEELAKLRRGMTILATVGSTAPFVGLFGTTFGVINAFQGMATAGSGLASISAGISEALITTGVGIGVAVLGVWFYNYFNHRIDKVTEELASSEADFLDWAEKLIVERTEDTREAGK
jgi:biopolymer transport protein ExbB/TolQ